MENTNKKLKLINLGGVSVQKNIYVYELEDEAIIVDCGIGFPEVDDYGVDIIVPDFTYILQIQHKIKGLLITHGHDDHYSATPYLMQKLPLTIYAHPLVQSFLKNKLKDFSDCKPANYIDVDPEKDFTIGSKFKISPYRVNHSVPHTLGFFIQTEAGTVVHQTDFKFDWTPVMDKPADVQRIASLSVQHKPILMLSDSLGATHHGYTRSEKHIEETFDEIVNDAPGQVFITTISSNISRVQQAINSAVKHNRKVVIGGYSMRSNFEAAIQHELLKIPADTLVEDSEAKNYKDAQLLYIVPGNYGQVGSTLDKIAKEKHNFIKLKPKATVLFSSDPIPGSEGAIDRLIELLILKDATVVSTSLQEDLHVSGHGTRGDLSLMAQLVRPNYFCPVGGSIKHMRAYRDMLVSQGFAAESVFELLDGETLAITPNSVALGEKIEVGETYIDNSNRQNSIEDVVINDRKMLAEDGVLFVILPKSSKGYLADNADIFTRGFIYVKENKSLLTGMQKNVAETVKSLTSNADVSTVKKAVEKALKKHLYKRVGEAPLIIVEILDV